MHTLDPRKYISIVLHRIVRLLQLNIGLQVGAFGLPCSWKHLNRLINMLLQFPVRIYFDCSQDFLQFFLCSLKKISHWHALHLRALLTHPAAYQFNQEYFQPPIIDWESTIYFQWTTHPDNLRAVQINIKCQSFKMNNPTNMQTCSNFGTLQPHGSGFRTRTWRQANHHNPMQSSPSPIKPKPLGDPRSKSLQNA